MNINPKTHHTFLIDVISPWINLGGVQLIPTATTCLHESAMEAHSEIGSPLTTLTPSLELKENHAGISMPSSSRSSAYACNKEKKVNKYVHGFMLKLVPYIIENVKYQTS
jgi:hypothetical protein